MIKAIAVDMDGTFLNSNNDYDRNQFEELFSVMREKGIKFIVASGNQYAQLRSFFPEKESEITFISENGALTFEQESLTNKYNFDKKTFKEILDILTHLEFPIGTVLCGVKKAYLLKSESDSFKNYVRKYYFSLEEVDCFDNLPEDDFVKFALVVPDEHTSFLVEKMNGEFARKAVAVSSGHGSIDIIIPKVHKGCAIQNLLDKWGISSGEFLAFGDGNNDIEMLKLAGKNGYAMQNGSEEVLEVAENTAPSNDEGGVLSIIEKMIMD